MVFVVALPRALSVCEGVFVWGFGGLFWSCMCVSGVLFSVGVCVCDRLILLQYTLVSSQVR